MWGTLIVPHILSWFKLSSTRVVALHCSKKADNPITLTTSPLPKSTSSTSTNSPLQAENSTFLWRGHRQNTDQNSPIHRKHVISREIFNSSHLPKAYPRPHQAFWVRPCILQNSSQIYTTAEWYRCRFVWFINLCRNRKDRGRLKLFLILSDLLDTETAEWFKPTDVPKNKANSCNHVWCYTDLSW